MPVHDSVSDEQSLTVAPARGGARGRRRQRVAAH